MKNVRIEKINAEMQKVISQTISQEIKDPRLSNIIITVLKVETTNDLSYSKIFVSFFPSEKSKELFKILRGSLNYIRGVVSKKMDLRKTPELILELDEGNTNTIIINNLIEQIHKKESK